MCNHLYFGNWFLRRVLLPLNQTFVGFNSHCCCNVSTKGFFSRHRVVTLFSVQYSERAAIINDFIEAFLSIHRQFDWPFPSRTTMNTINSGRFIMPAPRLLYVCAWLHLFRFLFHIFRNIFFILQSLHPRHSEPLFSRPRVID